MTKPNKSGETSRSWRLAEHGHGGAGACWNVILPADQTAAANQDGDR